MKKKRLLWRAKFWLVIFLTAIILPNCGTKDHEKEKLTILVDSIVQKENHFFPFYYEFLKSGIKSIPYLIDKINTNEHGIMGYDAQDPRLPLKYPINYEYTGCRAAYMIECLLSNTKEPRLYRFCVILKVVNRKPNIGPLTITDMENLKKIYSDWWEKNKTKSKDEIAEQWKNGQRPLNGTNYAWF